MSEPAKQIPIKIKYESFAPVYASQALVQVNPEEVILDFSAGLVSEGPQNHVMPIHTRVAMSRAAALRLVTAITQSLEKKPGAASGGGN